MKKLIISILTISILHSVKAQNDIDALLAAGVDDAQRFANDYLAPGTDALMHSINANWFNSADVKPWLGFEISVIANASLANEKSKQFSLNTADYNNVQFAQGPAVQNVATVLGDNDPAIFVEVEYEDPIFGNQTVPLELPTGIGDASANLIPSAFVQGALGLGKGFELKLRYVPEIETDDVKLGMYGAGLQFEVTDWLPSGDALPVAISGLVAYTHLDGSYDLTESSGIAGDNQRVDNETNTWLFQSIVSTKMPVINFYGGLGYIKGTSDSNLLGNYTVTNGVISSQTITDPFSVSSEISAVRGTLGTKLKLGFFRLNAEYHFSEFDAFSVGINFGFK